MNQSDNLREEVEKSILEREKRKLHQRPVQAKVTLNIDPVAIPLKTLDIVQFYVLMQEEFNCTFDDSDIRSLIPVESREMDGASILRLALKDAIQKGRMIIFRDGLLTLDGIARIVPFQQVGAGSQTISAVLAGSTDEAMLMCKNFLLLLWRASGTNRRWEDIEGEIARVSYTQTTVAEMPFTMSHFLSRHFREFIADEVCGESGFGRMMGLREVEAEKHRAKGSEMEVVSHLREFSVKVSQFNKVTGDLEEVSLDFTIPTRDDANRNRITVTSELPIEEHVDLVERLSKIE